MLFLSIVSVALITLGCTTMAPSDKRPYHHTDKGFRNLYVSIDKGFSEVLKMRFGDMEWIDPSEEAPLVPRQSVDPAALKQPNQGVPQYTWIGHSTFLIQYRGLNILTDPIFSERASPVSFAGPKRYTPPALSPSDLPRIDVVVISHNHYDHLDYPASRSLVPR